MALKLWSVGILLVAGGILVGCTPSRGVDGISAIHTDNYANPRLEYYYYIPDSVLREASDPHPVLVMMPGLSGRGEEFVTSDFKRFANEEGLIIIAPSFVFDEANWDSRQSYQYPAAWSGNALLEIIAQLEKQKGITTSELCLFGFSAGAQFTLRFCLWQPERCIACAAHASGGTVLPDRPVQVRFFVTVGNQDVDRIARVREFYARAKSLGIDVTYREYNAGHSLTAEQVTDSLDFLRESIHEYLDSGRQK